VTDLKLIPKQQFGFQRAHSTVHQLGRVIGDVGEAMAKRQTTALLLLDSEKAFDSVWIEGLIFKLMTYKITPSLCKLLLSYLTDRLIQVRVDRTLSPRTRIESGVPQGSVLSPLLYNLYISDLMTDLPPLVHIAGYADDIALYSHSISPLKAVNRVKHAAEQIIGRLERWKIKVNTTKTEAILLTKLRDIPRNFKIRGTQVEFRQCVKYLGVHIDSKLTWAAHLKTVNQTAKQRLGRFYRLLRSPALSVKLKLIIFKAIIRPCMTYACPIWHTAAKTNIDKLQVTQNNK
jgi:Reverse transcriptase (RNA-dependent DNA polymerase)